jgi:hypothetical protein
MARLIGYGPHTDWLGTRILFRWDAWGCPSILVSSPLRALVLMYNSDNPLGAWMNMDMLDHDRLAVPPPASIEGLKQVVLKFDQLVGVAAVHRDVLLAQVPLAEFQHAERLGGGARAM